MTPYHQNLSHYQVPAIQSINTQHLIRHQQSIQLMSPNFAPVQFLEGHSVPPLNLPNSALPAPAMSRPQSVSQNFQKNLTPSDPYSCNFLAQLEGSYERETPQVEKIQVELVSDGNFQYGRVRRQSGEAATEQLIKEEDTRFTLCSVDGFVLAVMVKGRIMRQSVTWYANDGSKIVWRRTGDVTFKLVTLTPEQSRRNSIASIYSGVSHMSYSNVSQCETTPDVRMQIRPELRMKPELGSESEYPPRRLTQEPSNGSLCSSFESPTSPTLLPDRRLSNEELFDQFRKNCLRCPSLKQRVIEWGITRTPNNRVGDKEISALAGGRVWVTATLGQPSTKRDGDYWQEILNDYKGAYQEDEPGVFLQPPAQPNEPGVQHRLRSQNGLWMIDEHNVEEDVWDPCARELPCGKWVDVKDRRMKYNIKIVPMESILCKMKDQLTDLEEIQRSIDFLFNSCNQKKLNTKLKARNLKHNISNLKLKLDKQYALSFAVRVSEIADSISSGNFHEES